jgi:uncharacterized tellurite resistance protein B-like protein
MSVWKMLGVDPKQWLTSESASTASSAQTDTVRKIVRALDTMEPARARHLAAFAYLLSRVAFADQNISPEETAAMERLVMQHGKLPEEQAVLIVQMAKTQTLLFSGTENFLVAREFAKITSRDEKLALLHCLYAVSAADQNISVAEDNEISKLCTELQLSHEDYIAVRMSYREFLAVLKP